MRRTRVARPGQRVFSALSPSTVDLRGVAGRGLIATGVPGRSRFDKAIKPVTWNFVGAQGRLCLREPTCVAGVMLLDDWRMPDFPS